MTTPKKSHPPVNILNLSFGVQSFTLACMSALGDLERVDLAVFADTGHEHQATYDLCRQFTPWLADHGITVHITKPTGSKLNYNDGYGTVIPAFMRYEGKISMAQRRCTTLWKIRPIRKAIRDYMRQNNIPRLKGVIHQWLGISYDEFHRMRKSDRAYIEHYYPLIERRMTRDDCISWLTDHNLPIPVKSSCVFCPFQRQHHWKSLTDDDLAHAIEIDELIRNARPTVPSFTHRSGRPLTDVLAEQNEDDDQPTPDDLCDSGYCWT